MPWRKRSPGSAHRPAHPQSPARSQGQAPRRCSPPSSHPAGGTSMSGCRYPIPKQWQGPPGSCRGCRTPPACRCTECRGKGPGQLSRPDSSGWRADGNTARCRWSCCRQRRCCRHWKRKSRRSCSADQPLLQKGRLRRCLAGTGGGRWNEP